MTTPLRRASDEQRTNVAVPIFALRTHDTAMLDRPTTLYRYFAAGGELLYVGITGRATDRAEMHRRLTIAPQLSPEESLALVETLDARVEMRRLFRILAILEWPDL